MLAYLAQQTPPIIHRDIKPANIIIGVRDKRAHLVDFGIARSDEVRDARSKQTGALGTPGYAPLEQYQGNADPRSDLYALAATLHHLLTNRDPRDYPPFNFPPVRTLNPDLSPDIERVLQHALITDRNQRYQSATAMKQEIDAILHQRFGLSGNLDSYTLGTSTTSGIPALPVQSSASLPAISGVSGMTGAQTALTPGPSLQPSQSSPALMVAPHPINVAQRRRVSRWLGISTRSPGALAYCGWSGGNVGFLPSHRTRCFTDE